MIEACVSNASPLITLSKIGQLGLAKRLYGRVLIGPATKVEAIDRGQALGAPDVATMTHALAEGWLESVGLSQPQAREVAGLMRSHRIGPGEAEALILARDLNATVLLDDKEARAIANAWNLSLAGTLLVLYEGYARRALTETEFLQAIRDAGTHLWIHPDVIAELVKRIEKVRK